MDQFTLVERSFPEIRTAIRDEAQLIADILEKCVQHEHLFIDPAVQYRLRSRMIALSDELVAANLWMEKRGVDPNKVFKKK